MAEAKRDQNRVTGLLLEDDVTGATVPATRDADGRLRVTGVIADDTSTQKIIVSEGGIAVGNRQEINLVEGANITLTVTDNAVDNRVDIEIASSGGGAGAPTNATYVTLSTNATLTDERVLTAGSQITLTDAGAGGAITVASPFYFDATVGASGADYTTLKAAIDAGKSRILVMSSTTEVANINIVVATTPNIYIYFVAGTQVDMGIYRFTDSAPVTSFSAENGKFVYAHTVSGQELFDFEGNASGIFRLVNMVIDNNSTANNCNIVGHGIVFPQYFQNVRIELPNYASCGIKESSGDGYFENVKIIGGGNACEQGTDIYSAKIYGLHVEGEFISSATGAAIFIQDSVIDGVFLDQITTKIECRLTNCTVTNIFNAFNSGADALISQVHSITNVFAIENNIDISGAFQIANAHLGAGDISLGVSDDGAFSNIFTTGTITLGSSASVNKFVNCSIGSAVTVGGDLCKFTNCEFYGGVSVSSGANNNGFVNCQFGADAGGGALTITIDAGSNNTRVIGCLTDAAISDAGTGTVLSANVVY